MAKERDGRIVDPLAEARWEQVRGDEEGMRAEWDGTAAAHDAQRMVERPRVDDQDAGPPAGEDARNAVTEEAGDPGGER